MAESQLFRGESVSVVNLIQLKERRAWGQRGHAKLSKFGGSVSLILKNRVEIGKSLSSLSLSESEAGNWDEGGRGTT